jgi:AraC-like DNA-binding protein
MTQPPRKPVPSPVPFITLPNWVKAAAQCGFSIEPIFRNLGIQTDLIHLESATIPQQLLVQVMEACIARSKAKHFPFVLGETYAFDYLPDLETFVTTSPTLREAARVLGWVRELVNPMINMRLEERGDLAELVLNMETPGEPPASYKPYFAETTFASVVKFGRMVLRSHGDFRRLCFRHAAPHYAVEYQRYFRLPVVFGQARNALEVDRRLLDVRLDGGYPALHQQAEVRVEQRLSQLPRHTGLSAAVEQIYSTKPGLLAQGIEHVAAELGLNVRTLQRKLREEGQRFAELQARVQYRLAMRYLEEPRADIETVSEKLGFSDRRSFTRAFTRWSGVSPSAFRSRSKH